MKIVNIRVPSKTYPVYIGRGATDELAGYLKTYKQLTKVMVITDETLAEIHLPGFLEKLREFKPVVFTVPSGEKAKTFEVYYSALTSALEAKLDRRSALLLFGGGAVGDLGGFVAATYMRGIPFIQVPTTILAHDSAVGGKVAINHPAGKNMIGAFHQPEAVFYDLQFLDSLPLGEKRSGFAEVIKHALIRDVEFYHWLLCHINSLELITNEQLSLSLEKGIKIKGEIVNKDEKETGIRAYLNFGHTLGHAIESLMGYGNITHGEAVMIGMVFALRMSISETGLDFELDRFITWVESLGYSTKIPSNLSSNDLLEKMKQDKKAFASTINMILLDEIGHPLIHPIGDATLLEHLRQG